MYALALTIFIYLSHFVPWVISRPLFVLPVLSSCIILLSRNAERAFRLLVLSVLFMVFSSAITKSSLSFGFPEDEVVAVYGQVVQDSAQKKGRMAGYRLSLEAAEDRKGSIISARGSVYVLSEQAECFYGDSVRVSGHPSDGIIIGSTTLRNRPWSAELRAMTVSWIRNRLRGSGAGELAMRLLLGAGEDGVYSLADDARLSGLSHVLALSGMHLSILASILSVPLLFLPWKGARRFIISSFLFLFSFVSGWRPSLMRAFIFRMLLSRNIRIDEAFLLSALILFSVFPSAVTDLGAEYSFISLAAIFLFSSHIDRGIRTLLPLPPSFSLSAAASASALLFSIPLTLSVFGCYQLGAIITSLPLTAMISIYMGLSLLALALPPLHPLLDTVYSVLESLFRASAFFPELYSIHGYLVLILASVVLMVLGLLSSGYVEPELQQHKRDLKGIVIPWPCDDKEVRPELSHRA